MTPILTTLGFVMHPDGERVLMVHRIARLGDEQLGKYNGLGGKVEPGEDVVAGMKRELREEAAIEVDAMRLRGTVSWPGFGRHGEELPMWEGDRYFLPLVFDPDVPQFHGCLPYHDGRPTGWSYSV